MRQEASEKLRQWTNEMDNTRVRWGQRRSGVSFSSITIIEAIFWLAGWLAGSRGEGDSLVGGEGRECLGWQGWVILLVQQEK